MGEIKENSTYNAPVADPLDPVSFVHNIKVPTFLACQWEDEQTGGHCADLVQHFTGTKKKWFTFTNGATSTRSIRTPSTACSTSWSCLSPISHRPNGARLVESRRLRPSTRRHSGFPKATKSHCRADPIQEMTNYGEALNAFEALPEVRVLFDNGAGTRRGPQSGRRPLPGL